MSISDGQKVDAANSNPSWMSRTVDTNTTGKVDLENVDAASGSSVFNEQREHNGSASFSGRTLNGAKDETPTWLDSGVGDAGDDLQERGDALTTAVVANDADILALQTGKINGPGTVVDNKLLKTSGTTGIEVEETGITVDDSDNITGVNDLGVGGALTVTGDLTVNGTTTTINTATLDVEDVNITINKNGNQATANNAAGLTVEMSDATDVTLIYNSALASRWKIGDVGSEIEVVTTTAQQTITTKDIDLTGTASANNRVVVSSDTTVNLTALARKKGVLYFDDTSNTYKGDDGSSLIDLAAGGGVAVDSDQNILAVQVFS